MWTCLGGEVRVGCTCIQLQGLWFILLPRPSMFRPAELRIMSYALVERRMYGRRDFMVSVAAVGHVAARRRKYRSRNAARPAKDPVRMFW